MYSLTKSQLARGWIEEIRGEMTDQLGVTDGSYAVFYRDSGRIRVEILPPPSPELVRASCRMFEEYKDAFAEMRKLGD
jgi:hypothetical protein